jgi:hypothetical protein
MQKQIRINPGSGGSAFPITDETHVGPNWPLTKRDYFAAYAMQALVQRDKRGDIVSPDLIAAAAYALADAMLRAREATGTIPKSFEGGEELIR